MRDREFLEFATKLAETSLPEAPQEAQRRTVVGRCYYSVFLRARARADIRYNPNEDPGSSHKRVCDHYKRSTDPLEKRLGKRLDWLRGIRTTADYELRDVVTPQDVTLSIMASNDIHSWFDQIDQNDQQTP